MRSVISSACRISSNDSARVWAASSVKPQLSCILECRKYWLIAVSSLVNCSLSRRRTSGSPCMTTPMGYKAVVANRARWAGLERTGVGLVLG
ncbi:Uncharacterised protein [Mycobacterium tuberculosis]|nr:Uncharacterised protein [Mycobacterium tuberculosis]COX13966.1 Uncharacterised protein [Mycobacterium tuberculosis]COX50438.1 Uncharacterised protein [Mycobacterium tuberculosis]COZ92762.1 Uncharacterised protein [Mycobacterium tuberculosis]